MSNKDSLGDRMKKYEDAYRIHMPERMPVLLRIDGKAFHSYTKGCKSPFDQALVDCMDDTAKYLCKNIMGAQLSYVQSDEISILLKNYQDINSQSYFDNSLQKIVSVAAGMASGIFTSLSPKIFGTTKVAVFDTRAWVLPKEEAVNYFIWRQQDATRNSVQMLARTLYSHKECNNKSNSELQEMCFQKGHNWNNVPTSQKRGRCIVKKETISMREPMNVKRKDGTWGIPYNFQTETVRRFWEVDNDIPVFSQDRDYIGKFV